MHKFLLGVSCFLFIGCYNDTIRKSIKQDNVNIVWYRRSYFDSDMAYVVIKRYFSKDVIMEMNDECVTDIYLKSDTIFIKMHNPSNSIIYSLKKESMGFTICIDSSASYNDWLKIYQPEYYRDPAIHK